MSILFVNKKAINIVAEKETIWGGKFDRHFSTVEMLDCLEESFKLYSISNRIVAKKSI